MADFTLDPKRTALIVQDMQNDVIIEGGAFADSGAPQHAKEQNAVENAAARRRRPLERRAGDPRALHRRGGRARTEAERAAFQRRQGHERPRPRDVGRAPADGLEPRTGDFVVEKMRMSAWEGTKLEVLLGGLGVDTIVITGAWTNMSIEHTARTGADKGYYMFVVDDCCSTMNADWHNASINFALQNVSTVTNSGEVVEALG